MSRRAATVVRRLGAQPADAAAALAVLALFAAELALNGATTGPALVNIAGALGMSLPLAWRRTRALEAALAISASAVAMTALATSVADLLTTFVSVLAAAFAAGGYEPRGRSVAGIAAIVAAVVDVALAGGGDGVASVTIPSLTFVLGWVAGRILRARWRTTSELRARADRLKRERAELAQAAVEEERARVARELHDVVAHSVSVMVVQAGAARRVLDRSPGESLDALAAVQTTGRQALGELRRLLGALRPEDGPAPRAPQERLATGLPALLDRARMAGLPVDVHVIGTPRPLAAGIDLAAYRIVQEALTNTLKHAGPAHATVTVTWGEDDLDLDVRDTGRGPAAGHAERINGSGLGLVGMRERVALVGGTLETGPAGAGGFRVHARLPQEQPAP